MSRVQMTEQRKQQIGEGLAFVAGLLALAGITEVSFSREKGRIEWDIPSVGARVDMDVLDSFFGEAENRYHGLQHEAAEQELADHD